MATGTYGLHHNLGTRNLLLNVAIQNPKYKITHKYDILMQTIWEGENGKIVFYQCEIPYDVPDQESWRSHEGKVNGFASIKLGDGLRKHESWGIGIYLYNRDAEVELHSAMEAPEGAEEIRVHNICTVMITGNPGISHIINEDGNSVMNGGARAILTEWPKED